MLLPISVVIPTLNRHERLHRTIASVLGQNVRPMEIIVIDASSSPSFDAKLAGLADATEICCRAAEVRGAAVQRNQGTALARHPFILFLDDDVDLQQGCLAALWQELQRDPGTVAAGVVLSNQHYHPPGPTMRRFYRLLGCPSTGSLAARFPGPALNFLPSLEGHSSSAEWLNLCCTLCRREALPVPPLLPFFTGYSLLEDAALTAHLAKRARIAALPHARAYHDYRAASYKDRVFARERMEVTNRWFVMTRILGRRHPGWVLRFGGYQLVMLMLSLRRREGWRYLLPSLAGKLAGIWKIAIHSRDWKGYAD